MENKMIKNKKVESPKPFPKEHNKEYDWVYSVYHKLAKKYPNMWIAFANKKILARGKSLSKVMKKAHKLIDWEEIPHLFIERGIHIYENSTGI